MDDVRLGIIGRGAGSFYTVGGRGHVRLGNIGRRRDAGIYSRGRSDVMLGITGRGTREWNLL